MLRNVFSLVVVQSMIYCISAPVPVSERVWPLPCKQDLILSWGQEVCTRLAIVKLKQRIALVQYTTICHLHVDRGSMHEGQHVIYSPERKYIIIKEFTGLA